MCDYAYFAVSGKQNFRAKCCPSTRYVNRWLLFDHSSTHSHSQYHILIIFPPCSLLPVVHSFPNTVVVSRARLESLQHLPVVLFAEHLVLAASQIHRQMPMGIVRAHFVCLAKELKTCPIALTCRQITLQRWILVGFLAQITKQMEAILSVIIPFAVSTQLTKAQLEIRKMVYGIAARGLLATLRSMLLDGPGHQMVLSCVFGMQNQSRLTGPPVFQPPSALLRRSRMPCHRSAPSESPSSF